MKKRMLTTTLFFLLLLTLSACGGVAEAPAEEADNLYVLENAVWESNFIPICWENPQEDNLSERRLIQKLIEESWEAASAVDFTGWDDCTPASDGMIHILLSDEMPHTKGLGRDLAGLEHGMVLNIIFANWGCVDANRTQTPCIFPYKGYAREDFIRITAVHEFGHALSFAHEQNRNDSPSWCDKPNGTKGTMPIGGWDLDSVMNYCNPQWAGDGHLSAGDIAGVQLVYGAPLKGRGNEMRGKGGFGE